MTEKQITLMLQYISAYVAHHAAQDSSDGGLNEFVILRQIEIELRETLNTK